MHSTRWSSKLVLLVYLLTHRAHITSRGLSKKRICNARNLCAKPDTLSIKHTHTRGSRKSHRARVYTIPNLTRSGDGHAVKAQPKKATRAAVRVIIIILAHASHKHTHARNKADT